MRLFIALPVAETVRTDIERRVVQARRELPNARWVKADGMHLTLVFLGETDAALLPRLDEVLRPVFAARESFEVQVTGGGTFPGTNPGGRPRPARVAWVGVDGGAELLDLQEEVTSAATSAAGIEADRRPFHPHLTVARCSAPWRGHEVERFLRHFPRGHLVEPFLVTRGILFSSALTPHGAKHKELSSYPLGTGPLAIEGAMR